MMDLLVQIATAHKLAASSYTLQAIGERGSVLPHQPNTPIGALDALQVMSTQIEPSEISDGSIFYPFVVSGEITSQAVYVRPEEVEACESTFRNNVQTAGNGRDFESD